MDQKYIDNGRNKVNKCRASFGGGGGGGGGGKL